MRVKPTDGDSELYIKRLTVEREGFLAGTDIEFVPGLNVIIGARGTGKTSVIELIRYCLGAGGFTEDAVDRGTQQARAILQGGAVSIEIDGPGGPHSYTRSSDGHLTATSPTLPRCTVLAQNEVEAVGAQAMGRIHLIDRYRDRTGEREREIELLSLELRSLTEQIQSVLAEGSGLNEQLKDAASVRKDLQAAREVQQRLLAQAQATDSDKANLAALEADSNRLAARSTRVADNLSAVRLFNQQLSNLVDSTSISITSEAIDDPDLARAGDQVLRAVDLARQAIRQLVEATDSLNSAVAKNAETRRLIDETSRDLRQTLDAVQSGVGVASRRVQELEERLGQLDALTQRLQERRAHYVEIRSKRDQAYEQLDAVRDAVFNERELVGEDINSTLGPQIRATVVRSARLADYESAIVAALRGTGLHYNVLAPQIAAVVSPFELVRWAEEANIAELTSATGISDERAIALVAALRAGGTAEIIASSINDDVVLELLDGHEYKPTDRLSIGQRCTVILPVLLGQHGDPLLVDQPEDHLDNAFIADTLVAALNRRSAGDQFIFTSHNANIPVLGEADQVIVMDSDGDRGYVPIAGPLDDPEVVEAINRILEGGKEAFERRSHFYAQNDSPDQ